MAQPQPARHHADQGGEYAVRAYARTLQALGVPSSRTTVGEAPEQGYAERLMRTIRKEDVALHDFADFHEADHRVGHCLHDVYQHTGMHAA